MNNNKQNYSGIKSLILFIDSNIYKISAIFIIFSGVFYFYNIFNLFSFFGIFYERAKIFLMLLWITWSSISIVFSFGERFFGRFSNRRKVETLAAGLFVSFFLTVIFVSQLLFTKIVVADTTSGCPGGTGAWTITGNCTITNGQCFTVGGNVTIKAGGSLAIAGKNSTNYQSRLYLSGTSRFIELYSTAYLWLYSGNCISSRANCASIATSCP